MSEEKAEIEVVIKCKDTEAKFSGDVNKVTREVIKFLTEIYPSLEVASKLSIVKDLDEVAEKLEDIIAVTPEGPVLLARSKVSDKDAIGLYLVAAYTGYRLGKLNKDTLPMADLIKLIGRPPGTVAGRLSELVSELLVDRIGKGEYKITTLGIKHFTENVIPKIKKAEGEKK